ncbi:hypothetical protein SDC9_169726 [bioreactor metagenome]|uniref:Uncharacterized protein n=1 Tax=bioreactor metagenome TaxID=1076179 RepID=A0A645GEY3_9ZZZZ
MRIQQGYRQGGEDNLFSADQMFAGFLHPCFCLKRREKALQPIYKQKEGPCYRGNAHKQRRLLDERPHAGNPCCDEQGIAKRADEGYHKSVLFANSLGKDKGILCSDSNDQAGSGCHAGKIGYFHGTQHSQNLQRGKASSTLICNYSLHLLGGAHLDRRRAGMLP